MYISREAKATTSICLPPPPPPLPLLLTPLLLLLVGSGAQREGSEQGQESWPGGGWKADRTGNAARTRKPRGVGIALAVSAGEPPPWGTA
eukprot:COSAG04_NODE_6886_length_1234_cov_1.481057_1_plen_89_part_10